MENNKNFIYVIKDPRTNEVRYVGQTSKGSSRFRSHLYSSKTKTYPICIFIKELIDVNLSPIFEIQEYVSIDQLDDREKYWIAVYKQLGSDLLNLTQGGSSVRGYIMTEESKSRFRLKRAGKPSAFKGKKHTDSAKKLLSQHAKSRTGGKNGFFGKTHSTDTIEKIKETCRKLIPPNIRKIQHINTGKLYISIAECARNLGIPRTSINDVLQKRKKSHKGELFIYV